MSVAIFAIYKNKIFKKKMLTYQNLDSIITLVSYADVAELADAQDLKSCGRITRAGSIPAICTKKTSFESRLFILPFGFTVFD